MAYLGAWPFHQLAISPNIIIYLKRANELTINGYFGYLAFSSTCRFTKYNNVFDEGKEAKLLVEGMLTKLGEKDRLPIYICVCVCVCMCVIKRRIYLTMYMNLYIL
jgi:hypothetical protein